MVKRFQEFINEASKSTTEDFIKKAKELHGDKYDYSKVNYLRSRDKVKIICPTHGEFEQKANNHLNGQGCPMCKISTTDSFIKKAKTVHGNKYDYSKVDYKKIKDKITIICKKHGPFIQIAGNHLAGSGCPSCYGKFRSNTEEFIERSKSLHGDKFDYSKVDYISRSKPVNIICKKHGIFSQLPLNHLVGAGCPYCRESRGELNIAKILSELNINFIRNKKFDDCFGNFKLKLPFDFYLPDYNICIEYDGEQHYRPVSIYGGEKKFKQQQINDNIKNEYCKKNGIELIRISYKISGYQKISEEIKKHLEVFLSDDIKN